MGRRTSPHPCCRRARRRSIRRPRPPRAAGGPPPFDPPPPFYLNDGHGNFTPLPPGDNVDAGETYVFGDVDGDGGHDVIYSKGSFHFFVRRELAAPVSTLYAAIGALDTSDGTPLDGVRAGSYNV